jgi:hypothetical protein
MPREKRVLGYMTGIVEYEVTDETHWAQMVGPTLTRCDDKAKIGGMGLVTQFNYKSGAKTSWMGRMPDVIDPSSWLEDHHIEVYVTEQDVS